MSGVCEDNDAEDDYHDHDNCNGDYDDYNYHGHDIGDGDHDDYEFDLAEQPWVAHELEGKCQ